MLDVHFPGRQFGALLFDFDGTVADTMDVHLVAWNEALAVYGLALTLEQHHGWAGRPTREIVDLLGQVHGRDLPYDEISARKARHYAGALGTIKAIVPVVDIIRHYHGQIPLAIITGSRRAVVVSTLRQLELEKYFDVLVCAEDYVHGKPAPDGFLMAAAQLKVEPAACLVFEDAVLGIRAAHAAGMACLRVQPHPELGHELLLAPSEKN